MFEKYIVVEDSLRNTVENGQVTGFQVGARMPYYRGLGLSMVEAVQITVNGRSLAAETISLTVHGNTYRLLDLPGVLDDRWEMGEVALLTVDAPGGLEPGDHDVEIRQQLRVSYMPVPSGGTGRKTLTLQA